MQLLIAPTWPADPPAHFKGRHGVVRQPGQVDTLLVHQTAVAGGFGAASLEARIARYGGRSRARPGTPYHYVYSPQDAAVVALWHPRLYSYHGNGGNRYSVGYAVDGKWPGDELDAGQLEEATRLVLDHLADIGYPVTHLEAHRQHSQARGGDPGPQLWGPIVRACAQAGRPACLPRAHVTGTGQAIPASWG